MSLVRNVIVPLYDFFTRNKARQYLKFLEKSQWFTPEKLRENQEQLLRQLIQHVYDTVPYYHRIFKERDLKVDDIKTVEDLKKLPILTRRSIMENWDNLLSREYPRKKMRLGATSGSSGEPLRFYTTKESRERSWATRLRSYHWAGFEVGDKFAYLSGLEMDLSRFTFYREKLENKVRKCLFLNCFQMSEHTLDAYTHKLISFKPEVIYGLPSLAYLIAKLIEEKGFDRFEAKAVITDSQKLLDHERVVIERVFGCKVWDHYHNRENGTFAAECSEHSGYHLNVENHIFEFVADTEPVAPGEMGAILVTDIRNYAMPFIRYENGDVASPRGGVCRCGRGLPMMSSLYGRQIDVLVSKTGKLIFFPFVTFSKFLLETKIKQYQIIQETFDKLLIKLVVDKEYSERESKRIMNIMNHLFEEDVDIEFNFVDSIPHTTSGKYRYIISKVPLEFNKIS